MLLSASFRKLVFFSSLLSVCSLMSYFKIILVISLWLCTKLAFLDNLSVIYYFHTTDQLLILVFTKSTRRDSRKEWGACHLPLTFFLGWVLWCTNTVKVIPWLSSFIGAGKPHVPLNALFQAQAGTWVEPPTFCKLVG